MRDDLERQENILAICVAQGEAAKARDRALLELKTEALSLLIDETVEAEATRMALVQSVVEAFGMTQADATLSSLIAVLPQPFKERMSEFRMAMRATLEKTQRVVQENGHMVREMLLTVNRTLRTVAEQAGMSSVGYTAKGAEPSFSTSSYQTLNQQG